VSTHATRRDRAWVILSGESFSWVFKLASSHAFLHLSTPLTPTLSGILQPQREKESFRPTFREGGREGGRG